MKASLATYFHGITEEISLAEVGSDGLPVLRKLLADRGFPRRDNVVAFLGFLGGAEETDAILAYMSSPPASPAVPEEDRSLLLAPQSLGRIAFHGDRGALASLMGMTAHGSRGGLLARAATVGSDPASLRDDLLEMALTGLAYSGSPEARERLVAVSRGKVVPASGGRSLLSAAYSSLQLFDRLHRPGSAPSATPAGNVGGVDAGAVAASVAGFLDTQSRVQLAGLTYANHVNVSSPMDDVRLDAVLKLSSLRAGRADFADDVACCSTVSRSGAAKSFGTATDGLDLIDNDTELRAVLNNSVARFKVVRAINYCGSPAANIIGCGWQPGNGAAVVRMSDQGSEAVLWIHEYGHNTGLAHNSSNSRNIMYPVDYGTNDALNQTECNTYHFPSSSSGMVMLDTGACTDIDADLVHDGIDNCPTVFNPGQEDADKDGIGDACDTGGAPFCGNGIRETGEACDGSDLGGQSCRSLGYGGGVLACTAACALDTSGCCADADGDGVAVCEGDCNDSNPTIYPGAPEICNDGIDQDCNGSDKTKGCGGKGGSGSGSSENCRNGVDDDGDGLVDCADPDCVRSRYCR